MQNNTNAHLTIYTCQCHCITIDIVNIDVIDMSQINKTDKKQQ